MTEVIEKIEKTHGNLKKYDILIVDRDHLEINDSPPLDNNRHRQCQMLIGMLNWLVYTGRMDIAFSTSSLSRFTAHLRMGYLLRVLQVFGYLKRHKNRIHIVDSRNPIIIGGTDAMNVDFTNEFSEFYPDTAEEIE